MKSLVIIPSIRNAAVVQKYIKNAIDNHFDRRQLFFLMLIEDSSDKNLYQAALNENSVEGLVFNQKDRDDYLDENRLSAFGELIPKKSHAETSFGLLYLWRNKQFANAFLIDDDTEPEPGFDYFGQHLNNLDFAGEIPEVSSDKKWANVLYQGFEKHRLYPRGYPYSKMQERVSVGSTKVERGTVWMSQGLWTNVPDLDAVRILMDGDLNGQSRTRLSLGDFDGNFAVAKGNALTVCSMNLAIRRDVVPFFYQFPMDDNPWKIGRFDDIWSGIVAKKVIDLLGRAMVTGFPLCRHNKAPRNTFRDLCIEAAGYESNEHFSDELDKLDARTDSDVPTISAKIAEYMSKSGATDFIRYCGKRFEKWTKLCNEIQC